MKVSFPALEILCVRGLGLREIWKNQIPVKSFCELRSLVVFETPTLSSIIPSNLFPRLQNLQRIKVWRCDRVKEILGGSVAEGYATISMPQLEYIWLVDLPKLQRFCETKCDFEWPSMRTVLLNNCLEMQTFTFGYVSTPGLESISTNWGQLWKGNLNSTVQHAFQVDFLCTRFDVPENMEHHQDVTYSWFNLKLLREPIKKLK